MKETITLNLRECRAVIKNYVDRKTYREYTNTQLAMLKNNQEFFKTFSQVDIEDMDSFTTHQETLVLNMLEKLYEKNEEEGFKLIEVNKDSLNDLNSEDFFDIFDKAKKIFEEQEEKKKKETKK